MALTADEVSRRFPIHWLVWNNRHEELKTMLEERQPTSEELEVKDPRGRTPLLLAVTLGHFECVRALADAGADVNCEKDGWTPVHEATVVGDPEMLAYMVARRDRQRAIKRGEGIPTLLRKLSLAPDFYLEMKWEFTSWVPLVSRMCPFDTYKVYKRGGNLRVDTTLLGFENNRWQRGDRTYIFRSHGFTATLMELDHENQTYWSDVLTPITADKPMHIPSRRSVEPRLAAPIAINYLDIDKICFERSKTGLWGWRQDKTEDVNGYQCRVFSANNVELVSRTRSEHLPRSERRNAARAPIANFLALADSDDSPLLRPDNEDEAAPSTRSTPLSRSRNLSSEDLTVNQVSWEEYFSGAPMEKDIGKPKEVSTRVQKFKASLWLCESYPLELQEQLMPVLDLMAAISSPHFAKLKDFIQMQLPAGFPVKIEIPLFHVINARITFGNIFAMDSPVLHVEHIQEGDRVSCVIDDGVFYIGKGYRDVSGGPGDDRLCADEEEDLLQYAIQQSLMEAGTHEEQVDVWEALRGARPASPLPAPPAPPLDHSDTQLQRAIEESLATLSLPSLSEVSGSEAEDPELAAALALSARESEREEERRQQEQRALDEALRLSLLDK